MRNFNELLYTSFKFIFTSLMIKRMHYLRQGLYIRRYIERVNINIYTFNVSSYVLHVQCIFLCKVMLGYTKAGTSK